MRAGAAARGVETANAWSESLGRTLRETLRVARRFKTSQGERWGAHELIVIVRPWVMFPLSQPSGRLGGLWKGRTGEL